MDWYQILGIFLSFMMVAFIIGLLWVDTMDKEIMSWAWWYKLPYILYIGIILFSLAIIVSYTMVQTANYFINGEIYWILN